MNHRAHCVCPSDDPVRCMELRHGRKTRDYDGSWEECSCACHEEIARDEEDAEMGGEDCDGR